MNFWTMFALGVLGVFMFIGWLGDASRSGYADSSLFTLGAILIAVVGIAIWLRILATGLYEFIDRLVVVNWLTHRTVRWEEIERFGVEQAPVAGPHSREGWMLTIFLLDSTRIHVKSLPTSDNISSAAVANSDALAEELNQTLTQHKQVWYR